MHVRKALVQAYAGAYCDVVCMRVLVPVLACVCV